MTHCLKTWPQFFQPVWEGGKRAEIRKNDRTFTLGDYLLLQEWVPDQERYTGREIEAEILHISEGPSFGLEAGYVMLSIKIYQHREIRYAD